MEISDDLSCLFTAEVEEQGDSYVIEVPTREVTNGRVQIDQVCRTALLLTEPTTSEAQTESQDQTRPPVEEGEQRTVDIEDIGEQGDGIARVERGYVIIVPDTEQGERVTIKVRDVSDNVAFAKVVERQDYYE